MVCHSEKKTVFCWKIHWTFHFPVCKKGSVLFKGTMCIPFSSISGAEECHSFFMQTANSGRSISIPILIPTLCVILLKRVVLRTTRASKTAVGLRCTYRGANQLQYISRSCRCDSTNSKSVGRCVRRALYRLPFTSLFQQRAQTSLQNAKAVLLRHGIMRFSLPVADKGYVDERSGKRTFL